MSSLPEDPFLLSIEDCQKISEAYLITPLWQLLRDASFKVYGEKSAIIWVKFASRYNDEGYDDALVAWKVYDQEGHILKPLFGKDDREPFWELSEDPPFLGSYLYPLDESPLRKIQKMYCRYPISWREEMEKEASLFHPTYVVVSEERADVDTEANLWYKRDIWKSSADGEENGKILATVQTQKKYESNFLASTYCDDKGWIDVDREYE